MCIFLYIFEWRISQFRQLFVKIILHANVSRQKWRQKIIICIGMSWQTTFQSNAQFLASLLKPCNDNQAIIKILIICFQFGRLKSWTLYSDIYVSEPPTSILLGSRWLTPCRLSMRASDQPAPRVTIAFWKGFERQRRDTRYKPLQEFGGMLSQEKFHFSKALERYSCILRLILYHKLSERQ